MGLTAGAASPILVDDSVVGVIDLFGPDAGQFSGPAGRRGHGRLRPPARALPGAAADRGGAAREHGPGCRGRATDPSPGCANRRDSTAAGDHPPGSASPSCAHRRLTVSNMSTTNLAMRAGDALLRAVSLTLSSSFEAGTWVARVGGTSSPRSLVGTGPDETAAAAERMCNGRARHLRPAWAGAGERGLGGRVKRPRTPRGGASGRLPPLPGQGGGTGPRLWRHHRPSSRALTPLEWATRVDRAIRNPSCGSSTSRSAGWTMGSSSVTRRLARPPEMRGRGERRGPLRGGTAERADARPGLALPQARHRDAPWGQFPHWALFLNVSALTLLDPIHGADQLLLILEAGRGAPRTARAGDHRAGGHHPDLARGAPGPLQLPRPRGALSPSTTWATDTRPWSCSPPRTRSSSRSRGA